MSDSNKVRTNFFVDGEHWATRWIHHVPRAGDEVRFHEDKYFTVKRLVWPMDEDNHNERCNIELVKAS